MTTSDNRAVEAVLNAGWSDVVLHGFRWVADGRDLLIELRFPGAGSNRMLLCQWTSNLSVKLEFDRGHGGFPMTWDVTFDQKSDVWQVNFDFAGKGDISFRCNNLLFLPKKVTSGG